MKFIALISLCVASSLAFRHPDPEVCTRDLHAFVDQLFLVAESFEKDYGHPDPIPMKKSLVTMELFLKECPNVHVPLSSYQNCIDNVMPIFPDIRELVENARKMPVIDIVVDASDIALTLVVGISKCLRDHHVTASFL